MKFRIEARGEHLLAELHGREIDSSSSTAIRQD
jgi:hypothetical protein